MLFVSFCKLLCHEEVADECGVVGHGCRNGGGGEQPWPRMMSHTTVSTELKIAAPQKYPNKVPNGS